MRTALMAIMKKNRERKYDIYSKQNVLQSVRRTNIYHLHENGHNW